MPVKIKGFDEQGGYNNQNQNENLGGGPGGPESGDVFIDAGGTGGGSSSGGSVVTPTTTNPFVLQ